MARNVNKTPGRKVSPPTKIKDPIEVFCRLRPIAEKEETCVEILGDTTLQAVAPKNSSSRVEKIQCKFNKIFPELITQKQIYDEVGLPLVSDLLLGKNGLCFMYGITGSGKTFTMNGSGANSGVLPRCLDTVFNSINHLQTARCIFKSDGYNGFTMVSDREAKHEAETNYAEFGALQRNNDIYDTPRLPDTTILEVDEDNNYAVFVSFVEIYNNSVFDLLEDVSGGKTGGIPKPPGSKILREDQRNNMFVYGVTELECKNAEEAYTLFSMGQQRRKTAHTLLNTESSRSHCVFSIKLVQIPLGPNGDTILRDPALMRVSQLSLCDLAGSERAKRTNTEGEKMRQAGHINNSLMALRVCVETLRFNQRNPDSPKIVPYRDSKLTHLFKNNFDSDGKVRMVVCLNPSAGDFDESLHVMKFAEMTQEVKVERAEGVRFDLGFAAGRGKAHQQLKSAGIVEEGGSSENSPPPEELLPALEQFGPWPLCLLSGYKDDTTLPGLESYLQERIKQRERLYNNWNQKQIDVRNLICQREQDNLDLTKALDDQRVLLSEKEKEMKSYEKKNRALNEKYDGVQRSLQTYESQNRQLTAEVEKYKEIAHKERQEKLRLRQTLKDLTSNERLRWEKECNRRVHDKEMEMEGEVLKKKEKLAQLRDIVKNLQLPDENRNRLNEIVKDSPMNVLKPVNTDTPLREQQRERTAKKGPAVQPKPNKRTTISNATPQRTPKIRSKSPPPTLRKNAGIAPIRTHRRSRSTDFWLNHQPEDTLGTDTLMQPMMKNKKNVKTPSVKDIKVIPNYVLTHQSEDSGGEIQTKLIKGEVMPTRGGGSSVQFTEIETLSKKLSKTPGKTPLKTKRKAQKSEENETSQRSDTSQQSEPESWNEEGKRMKF